MALTEDQKQLLQATMDRIDAVPEQWRQREWGYRTADCGTKACFAGWAVVIARPEIKPPLIDEGGLPAPYWMVDGKHVSEVAAELLGLTEEQADTLFMPSNTRNDLACMVRLLISSDGSATDDELCEPAEAD